MHKFIALIVGAVIGYIANELLGEGQRNNIISIIIAVIVALVVWLIPF